MTEVRALVAGKVLEVLVHPGANVAEDDELIILESMKMEIPVSAPAAGSVLGIHVSTGDSVQANHLLVTIG